jgi:hypothetical protein
VRTWKTEAVTHRLPRVLSNLFGHADSYILMRAERRIFRSERTRMAIIKGSSKLLFSGSPGILEPLDYAKLSRVREPVSGQNPAYKEKSPTCYTAARGTPNRETS